jgi:hypothetical protein
MTEMSSWEPSEHLEEGRVEAFLAPLAEVSPASRANGRRRARARVRRFVVMALLLLALGAGIAVAAENEPTATVINTNGNTTTVPLIPVAPPAHCRDPSCPNSGGHHHQSQARTHHSERSR